MFLHVFALGDPTGVTFNEKGQVTEFTVGYVNPGVVYGGVKMPVAAASWWLVDRVEIPWCFT